MVALSLEAKRPQHEAKTNNRLRLLANLNKFIALPPMRHVTSWGDVSLGAEAILPLSLFLKNQSACNIVVTSKNLSLV
jgi:hypothetical protein